MACPANHPKLNKTVRVAVTGAAGNIGYALLFRLASGAVFGPNTPVQLQLLERDNEQSKAALQGVCMELFDCAFPLLTKVVTTSDPRVAFDGANAAFLIGSMPRGAGMDRSDLLLANGPIFQEQGRALDEAADRNVKVLVVGNPCNTNATRNQRLRHWDSVLQFVYHNNRHDRASGQDCFCTCFPVFHQSFLSPDR